MRFSIPVEHKNAAGVYIIRNSINGKVYVGSTANFWTRYRTHRNKLNQRKHYSSHLQSFVNKHGIGVLTFELLEVTERLKADILACEQKWLDLHKPYLHGKGFNSAPRAESCLGVKHSENTKRKLKASYTEERRDAMRSTTKELWQNPEYRKTLTEAATRKSYSPEQRENMAEIRRRWWAGKSAEERKKSPESIAKRTASLKKNQAIKPRAKLSEEAKQAISQALKGKGLGRKWSAESIAKRSATIRAKKMAAA